jgi:hypothetical protein
MLDPRIVAMSASRFAEPEDTRFAEPRAVVAAG